MSTEQNKNIVRRLFDAVNQPPLDDPDTLIGHAFQLNGQPVGLTDFKEFFTWRATVLTELHIAIEDLIAEGDKVLARLLRWGIHQGWPGVASTGKPTTTNGICIFRIADGKIVEAWDTWDELGLLDPDRRCMEGGTVGGSWLHLTQGHIVSPYILETVSSEV